MNSVSQSDMNYVGDERLEKKVYNLKIQSVHHS